MEVESTRQSEILIRKATVADFEGVNSIFAKENRFHANLLPKVFRILEPIITRAWLEEVLANPDKILFVAEKKDEIVGIQLLCMRTNPDDPIFKEHCYAYVDELAVAKEHRRQGVGRLLVKKAKQWAIKQGVKEIQLDVWETNQGALNFYEKIGYKTIKRRLKYDIEFGP